MAKLFDLSGLPDSEFLLWLKDPINIFTGNIANLSGSIYENSFSKFVKNPELFLEHIAFAGIGLLNGKRLGYITPEQKFFAEMLAKTISTCSDISNMHIKLMGKPTDDFFNTYNRVWKAEVIREALSKYTSLDNGKQCIKEDNVKILKDIASGCFGTVHLASVDDMKFAMKKTIEKVNAAAIKHAYDPKYEAWDEINFLKPYLNSLVEKGICQNVPYIYSNLICNTCDFRLKLADKCIMKQKTPCNTIIMELANGTLSSWYEQPNLSDERQYACFFQCMAGIHAIQKYFQMSNRDVKSINILYTNCKPGGYWEYVIKGKSYYIPNFGEVFTINDYGVGMSFDSYISICKRVFNTTKNIRTNNFDIGYRPFIVVDNKLTPINYLGKVLFSTKFINKKPSPLLIKSGDAILTKDANQEPTCVLSDEQLKEMKKKGLTTDITNPLFFSDAMTVPFLDIYIDTQDAIRMFHGDVDRTVQDGNHEKMNVTPALKDALKKYIYKEKNLESKRYDVVVMTPQNTIAEYFIDDFFNGMFSKPPAGELLQRFII